MERIDTEPHNTHMFQVEIDGSILGCFTEVSGLSGQNEVFEIKEGGLNSHVRKFCTRGSNGDITLKRGFINDPYLFAWMEGVALDSATPSKNGAIIMLGDDGEEVCRFSFYGAFPTKWEGPTFNATTAAIAVESITLAVSYIELNL